MGLVVESTYNGYWLVDALKEAGYWVHLANTSALHACAPRHHPASSGGDHPASGLKPSEGLGLGRNYDQGRFIRTTPAQNRQMPLTRFRPGLGP